MNYYLFQNDEAKGPFTIGQVRAMWNAGSITSETHYCEAGSEEWRRLREIVDWIEDKPPEPAPVPLDPAAAVKSAQEIADEKEFIAERRRRQQVARDAQSWKLTSGTLSCPRCGGSAPGNNGCGIQTLVALLFVVGFCLIPFGLILWAIAIIIYLLAKPTYHCGQCGFKFK